MKQWWLMRLQNDKGVGELFSTLNVLVHRVTIFRVRQHHDKNRCCVKTRRFDQYACSSSEPTNKLVTLWLKSQAGWSCYYWIRPLWLQYWDRNTNWLSQFSHFILTTASQCCTLKIYSSSDVLYGDNRKLWVFLITCVCIKWYQSADMVYARAHICNYVVSMTS